MKNKNEINSFTGVITLIASISTIFIVVFLLAQRGINFPLATEDSIQKINSLININEQQTEIRVSGTPGLKFQGSYMTMVGGAMTSKSIEGVVPTTFTTTGSMASVVFQKNQENGILEVSLIRNNSVIAQQNTTAQYGVIAVAN